MKWTQSQHKVTLALLGVVSLGLPIRAQTQTWNTYQGNAHRSGRSYETISSSPTLRWSVMLTIRSPFGIGDGCDSRGCTPPYSGYSPAFEQSNLNVYPSVIATRHLFPGWASPDSLVYTIATDGFGHSRLSMLRAGPNDYKIREANYDFPEGFVVNGTPVAIDDRVVVTGNYYSDGLPTNGEVYSLQWSGSYSGGFTVEWQKAIRGIIHGSPVLSEGALTWNDLVSGQHSDSTGKVILAIDATAGWMTPDPDPDQDGIPDDAPGVGSYLVALAWGSGSHVWGVVSNGELVLNTPIPGDVGVSPGGLRRIYELGQYRSLSEASPTVGLGEVYYPISGSSSGPTIGKITQRYLTDGTDDWGEWQEPNTGYEVSASLAFSPQTPGYELLFGAACTGGAAYAARPTPLVDDARGWEYWSTMGTTVEHAADATPALYEEGRKAIYATTDNYILGLSFDATGYDPPYNVGVPTSYWTRGPSLNVRPVTSVPPIVVGPANGANTYVLVPEGGGTSKTDPGDGSVRIIRADDGTDVTTLGPFTGKGYVIGGMAFLDGRLFVLTSGTTADKRMWLSCYQ